MPNNKAIKDLLKLTNRISKDFAIFRHDYITNLNNMTRVLEIENRMACLTSHGYSFVSAFRPTAKSIAEMLPASNTETYIHLANEAIEMLARGDDPAEVLWHFDLKLERMKKGLN